MIWTFPSKLRQSRGNQRRKPAPTVKPSPTEGESCLAPTCVPASGGQSRSAAQQLGSAPAEAASSLLFWTSSKKRGSSWGCYKQHCPEQVLRHTCRHSATCRCIAATLRVSTLSAQLPAITGSCTEARTRCPLTSPLFYPQILLSERNSSW